jgi:type IV secretory pathway VirJ component
MKDAFLIFILMLFSAFAKSQDISSLPVVAFPSKNIEPQKGFILYLSGDGGENSFSKSFIQQLVDNRYPVVFFNSLKYFWSKKTPEQAAADAQKIVNHFKAEWKTQKFIIIGYSFGADVTPFLVTRLSKESFASVKNIVLLSPSKTTDFEVHVSELFGKGKNTGASVAAEINKIAQKPVLILAGEEESGNLDTGALKVQYKLVKLKGGHRYDSNTAELASAIFKNL